MKKIIPILFTTLLISACGSTQYAYMKADTSEYERDNALSECMYKVKLNKTAERDQEALIDLCMKSKGFRMQPVSQ